jgi:hypothetical protein
MPVTFEEPVEEQDGRDTRRTHPAFAQISITRRNGGQFLYGSDFQHGHSITLRIAASEQLRSLSEDRYHQELKSIVEVSLSEAQWASFVSSLGLGAGVPCTLQSVQGKQIPQIPGVQDKAAQFKGEAKASARKAMDALDGVEDQIAGLKISEKQKKELIDGLNVSRMTLRSSLNFVLSQFGEYVEDTMTKARIEVNAYAQQMLISTGLAKLLGKDAKTIKMLEDK